MRISDWRSDFVSSELLLRQGVERQARRQHQALLRARNGDVDAPFVMAVVDRGQRRDGIDNQERRVAGGVDCLADFADMGDAAGRGRSEEHTSELQSLMRISYAVFCLKKKKNEQQQE